MPVDAEQPYRLIGCLSVFPIAAIGTFMILDYPGPQGPFAFAEYFGWWALCILVAVATGKLIATFFDRRHLRWLALFGAISLPTALTLLFWEDIQPTTPGEIKAAAEIALRGIGLLAILGLIILGGRMWWRSRSSSSSN